MAVEDSLQHKILLVLLRLGNFPWRRGRRAILLLPERSTTVPVRKADFSSERRGVIEALMKRIRYHGPAIDCNRDPEHDMALAEERAWLTGRFQRATLEICELFLEGKYRESRESKGK